MQAEAARHLPDSCTIRRPNAGAPDATGGVEDGGLSTIATVACHVAPMGGGAPNVQPVGGSAEILVATTIHFPAGTDVRPNDAIVCNGRTYRVQQVNTGQSPEISRFAHCTTEAS